MYQPDPKAESDASLVARFAAGRDQRAFAEIVWRHGPMVMGAAQRILGNGHDAEDAFQATFLAFASAAHKVRRRAAIAGWLHATAVRTAKSMQRANHRWNKKIEQKMEDTQLSAVSGRRDDLMEVVDDELRRLPARYQTAVVLCDIEGLTRKQAASRLELPVNTVIDHIKKGRRLLRQRLVRRGVSLSMAVLVAHMAGVARASAPLHAEIIKDTTTKALLYVAGKSTAEVGVSQTVVHATREVITAMTIAKVAQVASIAAAIACFGGAIGGLTQLTAGAATIVTPPGLELIEGNALDLSSMPPGNGLRSQHIYPASDFAGQLDGRNRMVSMAWRPDVTVTGPLSNSSTVQLRMSTTDATPGGASTTFAHNTGPDETLVFEGPVQFTTQGAASPGGPPHAFDYLFEFNRSTFDYDPSQGNLLVDITFTNITGTPPRVDTQTTNESHIVSVPNAAAAIATNISNERVVTQFTFVPESSLGDFDGNGTANADDIDILSAAIIRQVQ